MSERMMWAAWRVWAADVRDRHCTISARADLLVKTLDIWQHCQRRAGRLDSAANLCTDLEKSIEMLIQRIVAEGIQPPAELSRIASR
jgi:hypothetical protein